MHPHLENLLTHTNPTAEPLDAVVGNRNMMVLIPLQPPPELLGEGQHLLLLIRREFGPHPLVVVVIVILVHHLLCTGIPCGSVIMSSSNWR